MLFHTTDGCGYCCFPAAFSVCAPPVPLDTLLFAKNPFYILPHRLNVSFRFILVSISPLVVSIFITTTSFTRVGGSFPQFRCNQSSWLIPAVEFTHPSLSSRNHFVEREIERLLAWLIDRVWCIGTECRKVWGSLYSGFCGRILELQRFNQKWSGFGILGFSLVRRLLCVNLVGFVLGWIREVVIFGKRVLVQSWLDFTSSVACRQQKVCWVWLRAWV